MLIWWLSACLPHPVEPSTRDKGLEPAATTLAALQQARAPRKIALIIGVDRYTDPTFPALQHAGADAREIAANLQSPVVGGFHDVRLLISEQTRREDIIDALRDVRDIARRDDTLIVYFSGHGTRAKDISGAWHRYLVPGDSAAADLARTAIDLGELQSFFASLAPSRKALIVDACFDGSGRSVVGPSAAGDLAVLGPLAPLSGVMGAGEAHLFATSAGRPAREDDALGHGVYTWYLLDAMSWSFTEADVDGDGVLSAWEAHDWARGRTIERTSGEQVPEAAFRVVGEADVVLAGRPEAQKRADRALIYLYPTERQSMAGSLLIVDGREKGALPKTIPLAPGRHHVVIRSADGATTVDGWLSLQGGRSYSADEVARLAQGPTAAFGVRAAAVSAPPLASAIGPGALGTELYWAHRRNEVDGRGLLFEAAPGLGLSPSRPGQPNARPVAWAMSGIGWQGDRGRIRFRIGVGLSVGFIPRQYPEARPVSPLPSEHRAEIGWWWLAAGPNASLGVVAGGGYTITAGLRPHVAMLDTDLDGRSQAVPFGVFSFGLEVDR